MNAPVVAVVYQIVHIPSARYYVGSTRHPEKRWRRHCRDLRSGKHCNVHMRDVAALGFEVTDWEFSVLLECPSEEAAKAEEGRRIRLGRGSRMCFNIGQHATGGDNLSSHPDRDGIVERRTATQAAAYEAMGGPARKATWGKPGTANPMYGRRHTDEAKRKISEASKGHSRNKGRVRSAETRAKISAAAEQRTGEKNPFFGRRHSAETKAKLAEGRKGKTPTNARPVIVGGVPYKGVTNAAREIGVSPALVIYRIKSKKWDYHYLEMPNDYPVRE